MAIRGTLRDKMEYSTVLLIALGILALMLIAFFAVFRGKGKFDLRTKLGSLKAEGENPPPPTAVPAGVKVKGAVAGKDFKAVSTTAGGVDVEDVKAKGNVEALHQPSNPPPKT